MLFLKKVNDKTTRCNIKELTCFHYNTQKYVKTSTSSFEETSILRILLTLSDQQTKPNTCAIGVDLDET